MPRLIWTHAALRDVSRRLADYPDIGRPVEELDAGFREKVIPFGNGAYVVLYRVQLDDVVILAIRHGKEAGYQPFP